MNPFLLLREHETEKIQNLVGLAAGFTDSQTGVYAYGFERPSAIQQRAIMPIIKGKSFFLSVFV